MTEISKTSLSRRALAAGAATTLPLGLRPPVAASGGQSATDGLVAQGVPTGLSFVTSPRLPLHGIGSSQIASLLNGTITDWREVGCPFSLPIIRIGIDGFVSEGFTADETVADYQELAARLSGEPGALGLVPTEQIELQVSALSIDGDNPLLASGSDSAPITRIGFGGDILFGRNVGHRMRQYGDHTFPMLQLKEMLSTFDLTICNWECFVSETIEQADTPEDHDLELISDKTLDFVTIPAAIEGVKMAGVDVVSLANNHAFYYANGDGEQAFADTVRFLDAAGMLHFGAGENLATARAPFETEINDVSIAIIGIDGVTAMVDFPGSWSVKDAYTGATKNGAGTNPFDVANIIKDIERLASEYDVVIPFFHVGEQYLWTPRDFVVDVTRSCIDAGAAAVVTSHPHTIMGMDVHAGKPIFHAIGNLVYDQMFSVDTRTGYILELTLRGKNVINFRIHGYEIFDFCQARLMPPGENAALLNRFWRSTDITQNR
ncbi:MAG: CapA family protein [Thermomicrobiales bacterium]